MASVLDRLENFGAIDAETDFRPEFFVPSTSWENVRRQRHPLVVGRKGTGKTALRKALLNEAESDPVIFATDLAFRDYPWNVHHTVYDESVGGKSRYVETWLFLMLIELAKQAVGEDQAIPPTAEAEEIAEWVRLFVHENWGSVRFDHRDIFRAKDYQVTRSFKPEAGGVSVGGVDWTRVPRARLGDSLNSLNRWLKTALARILRDDVEYFLVFDELDLDFSQQDEQYLDSITGLVLAHRTSISGHVRTTFELFQWFCCVTIFTGFFNFLSAFAVHRPAAAHASCTCVISWVVGFRPCPG
jgi:hypothetical protein